MTKEKESRIRRIRRGSVRALASLLLAAGVCACAGNDAPNADPNTTANAAASAEGAQATGDGGAGAGAGAQGDMSKFDAEIAALEKQTQKNPGDKELRDALSQAYRRRADALREAQQTKEALRDYRKALSLNPDNEEAQQRSAELAQQVDGETTGEYGEPAPLPITPNVTTGDTGDETPKASPTKEATRKKP